MKIFISGLDLEEAQAKLENTQKHLIEKGFTPVIPLEGYTDQALRQGYIVNVMKNCDAIFLFSNWIFSMRARIEKNIAEELGKKIIFEDTTTNDPKINLIKNVVENVTGLLYKDFITPSRARDKYFARMIFVHHCLKVANVNNVASMINRHISTMSHCIKEFDNEMKFNKEFREMAVKTETILIKLIGSAEQNRSFRSLLKG